MARWTASAKWAAGPALDGQRDMPLALRLSEGLGVAGCQCTKDVFCTLGYLGAGHLVDCVATPTVPLQEPGVDALCVRERMIAFSVRLINRFPRGQDKHCAVEAIRRDPFSQLCFGHRSNVLNHCERFEHAAVKEQQIGGLFGFSVLCVVSAQKFQGKCFRIRTGRISKRQTFSNDLSRRVADGREAAAPKFNKEGGLTGTRWACEDDATHEMVLVATPNVRAKRATTAWRAGQQAQNGPQAQRLMASVTCRWRSA